MHVSDYYSLGVAQPSLEFLDVDVTKDTRVFIDPHAFRYLHTPWGDECVSLLEDFYEELLASIRARDDARGLYILSNAGESNEAHLGLSRGRSRGNGVGRELARELYSALTGSTAVTSGLARDVEDMLLFVDGFGHDRVSDMTINVVRRQLIKFTQEMCLKYGIPTSPGVDSGPMWDRRSHRWVARHTDLPIADGKRLLLVPKAVVRKSGMFDAGDYLNNYVLPYLVEVELSNPNSVLVRRRARNGRYRGARYVTKKAIRKRENRPTKVINREVTASQPDLLDQYRDSRKDNTQPPTHEVIAAATETSDPDWDGLLEAVLTIPPGKAHADDYHRAIQNLLTALLYPALDMPAREFKIHAGRKRIDIVYLNLAEKGFFRWLGQSGGVECGQVIVECKNYTGPLSNPEFDQLTGRFSPLRGRFGLLTYRGFADDKEAVIQHCRDAALDQRGFVIALDDEDLKSLVEARKTDEGTTFDHLLTRFRELI